MKKILVKIFFTLSILSAIFFLSSLLIGVGQIIYYLRLGDWLSISALDLLIFLGLEWAKSPASWAGLFRIFEWLPLWLFSGLGHIIFVFLLTIVDLKRLEKRQGFSAPIVNLMIVVVIFYMIWFAYTKLNVNISREPEVQNQKETNSELKVKPNAF